MNLGMETETLEYKKSTGELKEAVISIASILNKHQKGELYFGVRNDGTPIGQIVNEKTLREVSQAIANHIEPRYSLPSHQLSLMERIASVSLLKGTTHRILHTV